VSGCLSGQGARRLRTRSLSRQHALLVAAAAALCSSGTFAQPASGDRPPAAQDSTPPEGAGSSPEVFEARAAFQEGIASAKAERWALARDAFERSHSLHPHAITTYNIGYCERQLGHWTRARALLAKALAEHRAHGEVELPGDLVSAAKTYLAEADRRVARVVVTIAPGAVAVDGRPLEIASGGGPHQVLVAGTRAPGPPEVPPALTFDVETDPGPHVFVWSSSGRPDVIANETPGPGSLTYLDLRAPVAAVRPPDPAEAARGRAGPVDVAAAPAEKRSRLPALVAFGVGAASLAAGTVSGLFAFEKKSDVSQACEGSDPSRCATERQNGNRAADLSTGFFIGGGVAVAVGAVLFFVAPARTSNKGNAPATTAETEFRVHPTFGGDTFGLEGTF